MKINLSAAPSTMALRSARSASCSRDISPGAHGSYRGGRTRSFAAPSINPRLLRSHRVSAGEESPRPIGRIDA
jgi:hypothetical protein